MAILAEKSRLCLQNKTLRTTLMVRRMKLMARLQINKSKVICLKDRMESFGTHRKMHTNIITSVAHLML